MKKKLALLMSVVMLFASFGMTGCSGGEDDVSFEAVTREFYFSTDNGATYGNRRIQFSTDETVYMQVIVNVTSSDMEDYDIEGELRISNIDEVDAYYLKGQKITAQEDEVNGYTVYPFTINTNEEWTFFFEFVPNGEGSVEMELVFDDNVPANYDVVNIIRLVEPEETEVQDIEDEPEED